MAPIYHVRLSITAIGANVLTELATEDLGETSPFPVPAGTLSAVDREMGKHLRALAAGREDPRLLGRAIFNTFFGPAEVLALWTEVQLRATAQRRLIRLLVDASCDRARNLPFGLMIDKKDEALARQCQIVRIVRRLPPAKWELAPRLTRRALIACSDPPDTRVGTARHLARVIMAARASCHVDVLTAQGTRAIDSDVDAAACVAWTGANPQALNKALAARTYDVVHLFAHGLPGRILFADGDACLSVDADAYASMIRGRAKIAILQFCHGGDSDGFASTAEALLRPGSGGDLPAVIAAHGAVGTITSTAALAIFYEALAIDPQSALAAVGASGPRAGVLDLWARPRVLAAAPDSVHQYADSPYRGLEFYREGDSEIFFGREGDVPAMVDRLSTASTILLHGAPGCGKSSFVRAGLAPELRRSGQTVVVVSDLGASPEEALTRALGSERPDVLVVDQLEELLARDVSAETCDSFFRKLADLAHAGSKLVLASRSDLAGRVAELGGFARIPAPLLVGLRPLRDPAVLSAIIRRPAQKVGVQFDDDAVNEMLTEVDGLNADAEILPLLSLTLDRVFRRAISDGERDRIGKKDVEDVGGMRGAVQAHADEIVDSVNASRGLGLDRLRGVFLALVDPHTRSRRAAAVGAIASELGVPENRLGPTIDDLVRARLVVATLTPATRPGDRPTREIRLIHDVLVESWNRLRAWIDSLDEAERTLEALRRDSSEWENGREPYTRRAWALVRGGSVGRKYLRLARAMPERVRDQRPFLRRIAARAALEIGGGALSIGLVVAAAITFLTLWRRSDEDRGLAVARARLAEARRAAVARRAEHGTALARAVALDEALPASLRAEAVEVLHELAAAPLGTLLTDLRQPIIGMYAPDASTLIAGAWDGHVARWRFDGSGEVEVADAGAVLRAIVRAPDGNATWVVEDSGRVRRIDWDAEPALSEPFELPGGPIRSLRPSDDVPHLWAVGYDGHARAIAPDTRTIFRDYPADIARSHAHQSHSILQVAGDRTERFAIAALADGCAEVIVDGIRGAQFDAHGSEIVALAFHDGEGAARAATASFDRTVRVWSIGFGPPVPLADITVPAIARALAFVDAEHVVIGLESGQIWLAETGSGALLSELGWLDGRITRLSVLPGARRVAAGAGNGTIGVFPVRTATREIVRAPRGDVNAIVWRSADELVVAATSMGPALWDLRSRTVRTASADEPLTASALAISGDRARIATGGRDRAIDVWDLSGGGGRTTVLRGHERAVYGLAFTPDGTLVSGSDDTTIRGWSVATGTDTHIGTHRNGIWAVDVSQSGNWVASGSDDESLALSRIFPPSRESEHALGARVNTVRFSHDERYLLAGTSDGRAHLVSLAARQPIASWRAHERSTRAIDVSPAGDIVVTGSSEGEIRWWRLEDQALLRVERLVADEIRWLRFSPDGTLLAVGSADDTARVIDAAIRSDPRWDERVGARTNVRACEVGVRTVAIRGTPGADSIFAPASMCLRGSQ